MADCPQRSDWYRIGRCIMNALFGDTVTVYNKLEEDRWKRTVVEGVQWTDKSEKTLSDGVFSIARYASVTFPQGTYEDILLFPDAEEDCIVYGAVEDEVTGERGNRIADLLKKYPKSGTIKSVEDNSARRLLKHKKVVVA